MAGTIHPLPTDIGPNYLSGEAGKRFFTPGVRISNDGSQQLVVCCRGCKQEIIYRVFAFGLEAVKRSLCDLNRVSRSNIQGKIIKSRLSIWKVKETF